MKIPEISGIFRNFRGFRAFPGGGKVDFRVETGSVGGVKIPEIHGIFGKPGAFEDFFMSKTLRCGVENTVRKG